MKPDTETLEQKQARFRDLIAEASPLQTRQREIGVEQIQLGFEINLLIAQIFFPKATTLEAGPTTQGNILPDGMVHSAHDIPRMPLPDQTNPKWCLASLVPVDAGNAAMTICDYLCKSKINVLPSEIHIQRGALRVLLVR